MDKSVQLIMDDCVDAAAAAVTASNHLTSVTYSVMRNFRV